MHIWYDRWKYEGWNDMCIAVLCLVTQSCPTLCDPMGCSPPSSFVLGNFPGKNTGLGSMPSSRGPSWHRSPTLQMNSLPSEPPGKPMNTRVDSLSLLQGIFPTQGSKPGLLHCSLILYQIEPRSPALPVDFLPPEPQGKSKNTRVDSLSLLQGNFLNPEIEPGSPALQADSLPAEIPGKPLLHNPSQIGFPKDNCKTS